MSNYLRKMNKIGKIKITEFAICLNVEKSHNCLLCSNIDLFKLKSCSTFFCLNNLFRPAFGF